MPMKSIHSDQIIKIFKDKGIKEECECCGKTDWTLMTNLASLILQTTDNPGLSAFPVIAVQCQNCGSIRFFSRDVLGISEEAR